MILLDQRRLPDEEVGLRCGSAIGVAAAYGYALAAARGERPRGRVPPAFEVTSSELVAAIVTGEGVHRAPYAESLPRAARS
ncbi:MAG TPA: hypothetical protein VM184_08710 [Gaiellaceae bacterium]|nr:hypothetical protein [Gaiellaceae bacterium]